jgi:hypothetical protein
MVDQAQLGYKVPLPGHNRLQFCPACVHTTGGKKIVLNARHVLIDCASVDRARADLGISVYVAACRLRGQDDNGIYGGYVSGRDMEGAVIPNSEHLVRGKALEVIQSKWLESWGASARLGPSVAYFISV